MLAICAFLDHRMKSFTNLQRSSIVTPTVDHEANAIPRHPHFPDAWVDPFTIEGLSEILLGD